MLKNTICDLYETLNSRRKPISSNHANRNSQDQRFLRKLVAAGLILAGLALFLAVMGWTGFSNVHLLESISNQEMNLDISALKNEALPLPRSNLKPEILKDGSKKRKEVFINWRTIHWGKLSDLTKPEVFYRHKIRLQSPRIHYLPTGSAVLQDITGDLRQRLRAFERQYGVNIIWSKPNVGYSDVTAQFIDFWDKRVPRATNASFLSQPLDRSLVNVQAPVDGRLSAEDQSPKEEQ